MTDDWGAVQQLIERLEGAYTFTPIVDSVYYPWVPLPLGEFFRGLTAAQQYLIERNRCWSGTETLLDVGSGLGIKLALAASKGWQAEGVELRVGYALTSQQLFPELPVAVADAFDWTDYGRFDLVYMYRPCVELEHQRQLTDHVLSCMVTGQLLFMAGGPDPTGLQQVGESVWEV